MARGRSRRSPDPEKTGHFSMVLSVTVCLLILLVRHSFVNDEQAPFDVRNPTLSGLIPACWGFHIDLLEIHFLNDFQSLWLSSLHAWDTKDIHSRSMLVVHGKNAECWTTEAYLIRPSLWLSLRSMA